MIAAAVELPSKVELPKPGIYPGVDFEEYRSWPAISNSSLTPALVTMQHFKMQPAIEETPEMRLGTLVHAGKFEPLSLMDRYVVMPAYEDDERVRKPNGERYANPRNTNAYRELVAEFEEANAGKTIVTQQAFDTMQGIVTSINSHVRACEYFAQRHDTQYEVAIVWIDPITGLPCKGRVDCRQPSLCFTSDLKTTGLLGRFESEIVKRGHDRQGAFYGDGLHVITGQRHTHGIVAAQNKGPVFGCRAAPLGIRSIKRGRDEYRRLLDQISTCIKSGHWTGYEDPDEWECPTWGTPDTMQIENDTVTSW